MHRSDSVPPSGPKIRAFALIERGRTYREKKGDYDRALADYSAAIRLDPDSKYDGYELRAGVYEKLGSIGRAIADLSKAISLLPSRADLLARRGYLYNVRKNYDLAAADFTEAIRVSPTPAPYYEPTPAPYYESRCYSNFMRRNYYAAFADCTEAIRLDPNSPYAYELRGNIYSARGQTKLAAADSDKAIQIKTANKVLDCYKVGNTTVADMYGCRRDLCWN